MQLFYTPDITPPLHTLSEEDSRHCVKVLRKSAGETVYLTDGLGTIYKAEIIDSNARACKVEIVSSEFQERPPYRLKMAVAPTKNTERYEWFLEKATEVGCDVFIPVLCEHSIRKEVKAGRWNKIISGAVKQSLSAWHPQLVDATGFRELVLSPFNGLKLITHCQESNTLKENLKDILPARTDVIILIGPEGDFSTEEINFALANGFREISLGSRRLRTETAALSAVMGVSFINQ